jgi:branched-chain amino acid aminotransferase
VNYFYSANPEGPINLPATEHSWLRGDGLFETIKSENGELFFLDRHITRLAYAAKELRFEEIDFQSIRTQIGLLLQRTSNITRGRFRITLFPDTSFLLSHEDAPLRIAPQKLYLSPKVRFSDSLLSGKKSLSYGEGSFGLRLAKSHGCDDLLYLNERDEVVETGLANILVEHRGTFTTPSLASGCLPGIVRGVLLDWFKDVKQSVITLEDIATATGLYVLSSMREIDLVTELHTASGTLQKFQISAAAEKLRADYLINSRSLPNS